MPPPPPPPAPAASALDNVEAKISPSIVFVVAILAIVFFVCGLLHLLVRHLLRLRRRRRRAREDADSVTAFQGQLQQLFHLHDAGVDQAFIDALPVFLYRNVVGAAPGGKDPFDCAVCLCEFAPDDQLRLLPKCSHAFHLPCIDTWLKSHSSCPLCRCNIAFVTVGAVSPEPEPERRAPREDRDWRRDNPELVLTVGGPSSDPVRGAPQSQSQNAVIGSGGDDGQDALARKDCPGRSEEGSGNAEIKEDCALPAVRAASSLSDTHREGRMSIADVLQASLEDELTMARESGLLAGSSGRCPCHGEHSKDGGRSGRAMPDAAKRLPSVGRSCFSSRSGRGKDSILPM